MIEPKQQQADGTIMRYAFILMIAVFFPWSALAENWPAWRGPTGMGVSSEKNLPTYWSATDNVRWKVKLEGAGVSAPVVWGEHIFLTASDGRLNDRLHVHCYHRKDGKLLWHNRLFGTAPTNLYAPGGMAVPTAATDGKLVYVLFGTGDLAALDFAGRPVWIRSLAQEYGSFSNRWGMAASPVLVGDLLVVLVDHFAQSYLLGVDAASGANRWKTARDATVGWTTPLAVKVGGRTEIIVYGTYRAISYDAADGAQLWSVGGMHMQCIPSPVVVGNMLVACSGENTMAIRLDGQKGDVSKSHVTWTNEKAKNNVPSPLIYDGLIYLPGDRGIVQCLDVATGKEVWKKRLGDEYHASPVAADGKIYFTSKQGTVHVLAAGRRFEVLEQNYLDEMMVASPAISQGNIFLRGEKHLFCVGK